MNVYEFSDTGWDWLLYTDHMRECELKVKLLSLSFQLVFRNLHPATLVWLARRHWKNKRRQREKAERTYLNGVKKCQVFGKEIPLGSILDEDGHPSSFNVHQALTLIQMGPKTATVLVQEKNREVLGANYDAIRRHHIALINQERRKLAASKDGNKPRLPRHYEPKGLI